MDFLAFAFLFYAQDVIDIHFHPNKAYEPNAMYMAEGSDNFVSPFDCPVTGKPVNGINTYDFDGLKFEIEIEEKNTDVTGLIGNMVNWPSPRLQARSQRNGSEIFPGSLPRQSTVVTRLVRHRVNSPNCWSDTPAAARMPQV